MIKSKVMIILVVGITLGMFISLARDSNAETSLKINTDNPTVEVQIIDMTNDIRTSKGLAPLKYDSELHSKARSWAQARVIEDKIYHSNLPDGIVQPWIVLGENVGIGTDANNIINMLVASPTHYENMIDPRYTHTAVGVSVHENGLLFFAQEFVQRPKTQDTSSPALITTTTKKPTRQSGSVCR